MGTKDTSKAHKKVVLVGGRTPTPEALWRLVGVGGRP